MAGRWGGIVRVGGGREGALDGLRGVWGGIYLPRGGGQEWAGGRVVK